LAENDFLLRQMESLYQKLHLKNLFFHLILILIMLIISKKHPCYVREIGLKQ